MNEISVMPRNAAASDSLSAQSAPLAISSLPVPVQQSLRRMFADPRTLEKQERAELVAQLRACVLQHPKVSELRVVYGMALCLNLDAQSAMEELAEAVTLDPNSFIAHLKMGELWMRLRVCSRALDHTNYAARLADNVAQSEMARRQAATLRTMLREGVDRNGYRTPWLSLSRLRRLWIRIRRKEETLATVDAG
ncbi:MAG: hypothetical protein WA175_13880 [Candidatus Acidiferrales bacterium]